MTANEIINILKENDVYEGEYPVILTILPIQGHAYKQYTACIMTISIEEEILHLFPMVGSFKEKYQKGEERHISIKDIELFQFHRYDLFFSKAISLHIKEGDWFDFDYRFKEKDFKEQKSNLLFIKDKVREIRSNSIVSRQ